MTDSKIIFGEFIRYAYGEVHIENWRERMNELCGGQVLDTDERMEKTLQQNVQDIMEEEESDFQFETLIIFQQMALEYNWFKCWFEKNYEEKVWHWDLSCDFRSFLFSLNYDSLMEIIDSEFCLK